MSDGQLRIELIADRSAPNRVTIHSTRPVHAARIFAERSVGDVRRLLPRLFSVCGLAQASASRRALAAATGEQSADAESGAEGMLVLMETAREHLWRVLIDWPTFTDQAVDHVAAKAMQKLLPNLQSNSDDPCTAVDALDKLLETAVFGMSTRDWLAIKSHVDLATWAMERSTSAAKLLTMICKRDWSAAGATAVSFLPNLTSLELEGQLGAADADEFVAAPIWKGHPRETTPLARTQSSELIQNLQANFGAGLITRLSALLVELARLPHDMRELSPDHVHRYTPSESELPANTGIGQVDAARGRLVHRAIVKGDRVVRYQILAPTEWNFHPAGVLATSLNVLDTDDRKTLSEQAALLATAIDPCVGYELRIH